MVEDSLLEELPQVEVVRVKLQLPLRKMRRRKKNQKRKKETSDSISLVKIEIVFWRCWFELSIFVWGVSSIVKCDMLHCFQLYFVSNDKFLFRSYTLAPHVR